MMSYRSVILICCPIHLFNFYAVLFICFTKMLSYTSVLLIHAVLRISSTNMLHIYICPTNMLHIYICSTNMLHIYICSTNMLHLYICFTNLLSYTILYILSYSSCAPYAPYAFFHFLSHFGVLLSFLNFDRSFTLYVLHRT